METQGLIGHGTESARCWLVVRCSRVTQFQNLVELPDTGITVSIARGIIPNTPLKNGGVGTDLTPLDGLNH